MKRCDGGGTGAPTLGSTDVRGGLAAPTVSPTDARNRSAKSSTMSESSDTVLLRGESVADGGGAWVATDTSWTVTVDGLLMGCAWRYGRRRRMRVEKGDGENTGTKSGDCTCWMWDTDPRPSTWPLDGELRVTERRRWCVAGAPADGEAVKKVGTENGNAAGVAGANSPRGGDWEKGTWPAGSLAGKRCSSATSRRAAGSLAAPVAGACTATSADATLKVIVGGDAAAATVDAGYDDVTATSGGSVGGRSGQAVDAAAAERTAGGRGDGGVKDAAADADAGCGCCRVGEGDNGDIGDCAGDRDSCRP